MAVTGWPTEAAAGQVATEDRWIQMARLWAPEGVVDGVAGELAPSFSAGQVTIQPGAAWINGHYAVNDAAAVIPVTADGLVVLRYTLAGSLFTINWVAGASAPTQTTAVWEIVLAKMTGGVMSDQRTFSSSGPRGVVGYAEFLAVQSGISAEASIIGSLITLTLPAGRTIRISAKTQFLQAGSAGTTDLLIKEDPSTYLQQWRRQSLAAGERMTAEVSVIIRPSAGTHSYRLSARTTAGTVASEAAATNPGFILFEDIGPV